MEKIAVFASGNGSNAERIFEYFKDRDDVEVSLLLTNKKTAKVRERAQRFGIPVVDFNRKDFYQDQKVYHLLKDNQITFIVLAGFLWLVPDEIIHNYPNRIINIHPSLLPKYGGKGMYGSKVHQAVIDAGDKETGITIHYVNENYDDGQIIFQAQCQVKEGETAEEIAQHVHKLEHKHFPQVIDEVIKNKSNKSL
ncbi:phosphoribosylglycinamide formyltransferase [Xanthovirga aplysinae]|uniref:phosphoribosylglycinamide formyltransferase n=1 Tax=Xanthovirga aplysinae TaxID=2529853 RepID=UPI001656D227|nr:phosphoribosylglycinamide formyltransferase [Xanthovirga aplysinae]